MILILIGLLWIGIIILQIRLCKSLVWLRHDLIGRVWGESPTSVVRLDNKLYTEHDAKRLPTNKDWLDEIYNHGGPLIIIPVFDLICLFFTVCDYIELRGELSEYDERDHPEKYWENKPLKR